MYGVRNYGISARRVGDAQFENYDELREPRAH